jgi:hypothetical protein
LSGGLENVISGKEFVWGKDIGKLKDEVDSDNRNMNIMALMVDIIDPVEDVIFQIANESG